MKTYTFKILVRHGIISVEIEASGIFAARSAVEGMYPGCRILSWR